MASNQEPISDQELIQQHRTGDPTAFGVLCKRYESYLFHLARSRGAQEADAADATQEALIDLASPDTKAEIKDVRAWLKTVLAHKLSNQFRKRGRQKGAPNSDLLNVLGEELLSKEPAPIETAFRNENEIKARQDIRDCLEALDLQERTIVISTLLDEMSYEDTARLLEITIGTVKSSRRRGIQKLQTCLTKRGHQGPT